MASPVLNVTPVTQFLWQSPLNPFFLMFTARGFRRFDYSLAGTNEIRSDRTWPDMPEVTYSPPPYLDLFSETERENNHWRIELGKQATYKGKIGGIPFHFIRKNEGTPHHDRFESISSNGVQVHDCQLETDHQRSMIQGKFALGGGQRKVEFATDLEFIYDPSLFAILTTTVTGGSASKIGPLNLQLVGGSPLPREYHLIGGGGVSINATVIEDHAGIVYRAIINMRGIGPDTTLTMRRVDR